MKLCKDCKYYERIVGGWCLHPETLVVSMSVVHGKVIKRYPMCEANRGRKSKCGPDGDWFEPAPVTNLKLL